MNQKGYLKKKSKGKGWNNKPGKKKKIETHSLALPTSCCLIPVVPFCLVLFVFTYMIIPRSKEGVTLISVQL